MRVAIVHDWLNQNGGAERVLEVLHEMFPQAPIYTSLYAPDRMPPAYRTWDIRTSFMQRIPLAKSHHQPFLPLYPLAFRGFDLSEYDLVVSNSSGFCHGVSVGPKTCHINYCLTPPRFLWDLPRYLERERIGGLLRRALPPAVGLLQRWDYGSVAGVSHFVAISQAVADRIRQFYHRETDEIIFPPVDIRRFPLSLGPGEYYLVVSRLVPYKRVDLAVEAFNRMKLPLVVAGDGRDRPALKALAGPTVRFLGRVPDEDLAELYGGCKAFLFPGEEDFGIAPLEAMACGRPVVAYGAGGALETVAEGVTGTFFYEPTPEALAEAVLLLEKTSFDPETVRRHAQGFDTSVFKEKLRAFAEAHAKGCVPT